MPAYLELGCTQEGTHHQGHPECAVGQSGNRGPTLRPLASSPGIVFWPLHTQPQQWVRSMGCEQEAGDVGLRAGTLVPSGKGTPALTQAPESTELDALSLRCTGTSA